MRRETHQTADTNPGVERVVDWEGNVEALDDDYPEYQASIMALPGIMGTTTRHNP